MSDPDNPSEGMGFLDHLQALRVHLTRSALYLLAGFLACYPFSKRIFAFLSEPVTRFLPPGETLAYSRLTEPFFIFIKVSALAGLFVASPFVLFELWLFVSPALYRNEKRYAVPFVLAGTLAFVCGAAFAFRSLFPSICAFFLAQGEPYRMVVTLDDYFSLLFWTVFGVALTFELPVVIGLLARMGLVTGSFLARHWQVALVGSLVLAAVITPTPDPATMLAVAVPLFLLYLTSIVVARLLQPRAGPGA